jgi:hypothetical protein
LALGSPGVCLPNFSWCVRFSVCAPLGHPSAKPRVGSEYFSDLSPELKFTIVDGIIGDVLARRAFQEKVESGFDPEEVGYSHEHFDGLSGEERSEIVQDWATSIEVQSEMDHNPVRRLATQLFHLLDIRRWGSEYKYFPELQGEPATIERVEEMIVPYMSERLPPSIQKITGNCLKP